MFQIWLQFLKTTLFLHREEPHVFASKKTFYLYLHFTYVPLIFSHVTSFADTDKGTDNGW